MANTRWPRSLTCPPRILDFAVLLSGNWLMRHASGKWFTLHLFRNNPHGPANPEHFLAVLTKVLALAETTIR
ncbi:MAG: hypothetical protein K2Y37_10715 [Pirellulales bacterium]|nr:hypothetical protein [Pirellulales bacterium]